MHDGGREREAERERQSEGEHAIFRAKIKGKIQTIHIVCVYVYVCERITLCMCV